jgi:hypothetical protein
MLRAKIGGKVTLPMARLGPTAATVQNVHNLLATQQKMH